MAGSNVYKHWRIVIIAVLMCMALAVMWTYSALSTPALATNEPPSPKSPQALPANPIVATTGDQINPALAFNPNAQNYLVVWENTPPGDPTHPDIWGRMVDTQGTALYGAFPIATGGNARHKPDVVYNKNNNEFLVVYEYDYDIDDIDIRKKRVSSNGVPEVSETIIANSGDKETRPVVVHNTTNNNYLVVWQRWVGNVEFGSSDIYGERLDGNADLLGYEIPVKTGDYNQVTPTAAYFTSLNQYSVMWVDRYGLAYPRIYEQRFDSSGAKVGEELNSTGSGANFNPNMVYNPKEDGYAFVYENKNYGPPDTMWGYVMSWAFGVGGWGGPIDWYPSPYDEYQPDITYNTLVRNYAIVWEIAFSVNDHDLLMELYQNITRNYCCTHIGPRVVSNLTTWEGNPAVASSDGPTSLVVWEDSRNAGNGMDIYGAVIWHGKAYLPIVIKGGS